MRYEKQLHLIIRALKIKSGGTSVKNIREISPNEFEGQCFKKDFTVDSAGFAHTSGDFKSIGYFKVTAQEAGLK